MALKITKPDEKIEVKQVKTLLYGPPGTGKTSLGLTASRPLLLDFDKGVHRAIGIKDTVEVEKWEDVADILTASEQLKDYDTIVPDTAGKMLDVMAAYIIKTNSSNKRYVWGGELTQAGYGKLKSMFDSFVSRLLTLGKDIVFIAHEREVRDGENTVIRPDIVGGSYHIVLRSMDMIGYVSCINDARSISFDPSEKTIGKNCTDLAEVSIPKSSAREFDNCMESLISEVKRQLNSKTESGKVMYAFKDKINSLTKPEEFDVIANEIGSLTDEQAKKMIRGVLMARTNELEIKYYPDLGKFRFKSDSLENKEKEQKEAKVAEKASQAAEGVTEALKGRKK